MMTSITQIVIALVFLSLGLIIGYCESRWYTETQRLGLRKR